MPGDVHVLGGAAAPFARRRDGSAWRDWVREAGLGALDDTGIEERRQGRRGAHLPAATGHSPQVARDCPHPVCIRC